MIDFLGTVLSFASVLTSSFILDLTKAFIIDPNRKAIIVDTRVIILKGMDESGMGIVINIGSLFRTRLFPFVLYL
jgi:hypothetical protein